MRRLAAPVEPVREVEDDRQLGELGRLEADGRQHDPSSRAGDLGTDARYEDSGEQRHAAQVGRDRQVAQPTEVHAAGHIHRAEANTGPHQLLDAIRRRVVVREVGPHR